MIFVVGLETEQDFLEGSLSLGSHWSLPRRHALASPQPLLLFAFIKAALFILEVPVTWYANQMEGAVPSVIRTGFLDS